MASCCCVLHARATPQLPPGSGDHLPRTMVMKSMWQGNEGGFSPGPETDSSGTPQAMAGHTVPREIESLPRFASCAVSDLTYCTLRCRTAFSQAQSGFNIQTPTKKERPWRYPLCNPLCSLDFTSRVCHWQLISELSPSHLDQP